MTSQRAEPSIRRGLALGCGGTLGFAWTAGALKAIRESTGAEPRDADALIGTSGGAEMTALLGSGSSVDELASLVRGGKGVPTDLREYRESTPGALPPRPHLKLGSPRLVTRRDLPVLARASGLAPVGGGSPTFLRQLARARTDGAGWLTHPSAWMVGMDYDSGERMAFGSPGAVPATLEEALCASWAVPGWFPPVHLNGRRFIDGGAASTASADLLIPLELDEVIVIAPMASYPPVRVKGMGRLEDRALRRPMTAVLLREIAALEKAGTRVVTLTASSEDLHAMGANFMNPQKRLSAFEAGLRTAQLALSSPASKQSGAHA